MSENGIKRRRVEEQLKTLAGERGSPEAAAQRLAQARSLEVLIAELRQRAGLLNTDLTAAEQALADINAQIAQIESEIPPVAASVSDILNALNGGSAGQAYIKGSAALGGDWVDVVGPLAGGSIIDMGSNPDGSFVVFRGGFMVALSPVLSAASVDDAIGLTGIYQAPSNTAWTFPATFSAAPVVSPGQSDDARVWISAHGVSTSSASARLKAHDSIAGSVAFRLKAEGYAA